MARIDRSYIGKGPVYAKLKSDDGGMFPIGNCSSLEVSFDEESKSLKDFTSPGGGNANILQAISSFSGNMVIHDYSGENLARALRGTVIYEAVATVTDEAHGTNGTDGEFISFDYVRDGDVALSVVTTADGALAEGIDYTVEGNGILIIGTGGIDATGIKVTYDKALSEVVEALTESGQEWELYFNGLNEAQSGKAVNIRIHRLKFSPAQGLAFIGDDFGEISTDFEVLSDNSIVGAGLSKFMKIAQAT